MRGIAGWAAFVGTGFLAGCSGEPPPDRPDLEACDDGVDNDGDGLVDCDDKADCGGLACRTTQVGDDDDDDAPPPVEILFDETECCDFEFTSNDCPQKEIGGFAVINRLVDEEAQLDVFCDRVGPNQEAVIQWKPAGSDQIRPTVANAPVLPESTVELVGVFVCAVGVNQSFTAGCEIFVEAEASATAKDQHEFTIQATAP